MAEVSVVYQVIFFMWKKKWPKIRIYMNSWVDGERLDDQRQGGLRKKHVNVNMEVNGIVKIFISCVSVHQRASTKKEALHSHIENGSDSWQQPNKHINS